MDTLNKNIAKKSTAPVKIMQFGEGNFLRAFVDWIIKKMNDSGKYNGHVVVVQPLEFGRVENLKEQDYLYNVYLQGVDNGQVVRTHELIDVIDDGINPYSEFDKYLKYAESEDLEVIISNTTEAGICLDENDTNFDVCPKTYPGKVLCLLKHRYDYFKGDASKGLNIICCELIDNNADELHRVLNELAKIKGYDEAFISWINSACHYSSTLVDRIVPGYPRDDIEAITKELGYIDNNVVKCEIFHLWVLAKEENVMKAFPCDQVGLNAIYADSIKPYKQRKVKILNGCHTCMVPVSYLYGIDTVRESIEDPVVGKFAREFVYDEVIQTIKLPRDDMERFANSVFERYLNPFVRHELMSIALNSISKYWARVLPTVKDYLEINNKLPRHAVFSLAALIKFYEGKRGDADIALNDSPNYLEYFKDLFAKGLSEEAIVKDVLSQVDMWQEDLNNIPTMYDEVLKYYKAINSKGMKVALKEFVGE